MKKTRIFLVMAAFVALFTATSCLDGYDINDFNVNYGVIKGNQSYYYIELDNQVHLSIVSNQVPWFQVRDGQRVIADYTILEQVENHYPTTNGQIATSNSIVAQAPEYKVRLNYLYEVLTKTPVNLSFISTPARQDSIGHDKIDVLDAWVGGNYLNVHFRLFRSSPSIIHFINLVYDDQRSTQTDIYYTMRHKAYNDFQDFPALGRVSFDIRNRLFMYPVPEIKIHLTWNNYFGEEITRTITYKAAIPYDARKELVPPINTSQGNSIK